MTISGQVARSAVDGGQQLVVAILLSGKPPGDFDYAGELKDEVWRAVREWSARAAAAEGAGVKRVRAVRG
jgi:hypothetical protein